MKRIKNSIIIILIASLAGLCGCSKFLTVDIPDSLIKENYWKTQAELDAALYGAYATLGDDIREFILWGDFRSDLYILGPLATSSAYSQLFNQAVTPTNTICEWRDIYVGINRANSFIKNAATALDYDPSLTVETVRSMESEAYALRALFYFYLVRTFGDVPVPTDPYESDMQNAYLPPLPAETVLDTIEGDLRRALLYAPESFPDPERHFGRITKNAVRAIWADVKLWRGGEENYEECIRLCEELEAVYDNKMVSSALWFSMFTDGNASESIFEYQYTDQGYVSGLYRDYSVAISVGSYSIFRGNLTAFQRNVLMVYPKIQSQYATSDTIRFDRTRRNLNNGMEVFKYTGISYENGVYVPRDGLTEGTGNYIFYRYREVLLIKAEALAMLGRFEEAMAPINRIRRATDLQEVTLAEYGTGELFFDKLLAERVAELGYEGKQWFSLVRVALHTGFDNLLINRIAETTYTGIKPQTMRARLLEKDGWFMPYFDDEVNKNPWLEQKPYYQGKI